MAKAKKLPSGNWRALVYAGTDPVTKKRNYESFTADTKKEAEYLAAEFARNKADSMDEKNISLAEMLDRYIASKENIISPSTLRTYKRTRKNMFPELLSVKKKDLTQEQIQVAVNKAVSNHAAKTVKNWHGLLSAALGMFYPSFKIYTTLPKGEPFKRIVPTDAEIKTLLKHVEGQNIEIPILLAATGSLRKSEIAALTSEDVTDLGININKALVKDDNSKSVLKSPKSSSGYRFVPLPQEVVAKLKQKQGIIVDMTLDQIYDGYKKALRECGLPNFRFHDLRHYYASVLHAIGVPDKYIMQYGGWKTDTVLKNVYQHVMSDRDVKEQGKVVNFFGELTKHGKDNDATQNATQDS